MLDKQDAASLGVCLVTGAGGFIGSHLVEHLVTLGCDVRGLVRYTSRGNAGYVDALAQGVRDSVEVVQGDVRDLESVTAAVRGADTVFHLAALVGIPYSYVAPRETLETNTLGTLNVLLAARDAGCRRIIQTSTSEVYGTARYVPIDEEHPLQAQSPYAASKVAADKLAESFALSYGLPVMIVRPFNTYGPRQSLRAVIPAIVTQALKSSRVALGNLNPTRDFTYVTDTARAFAMAAASDVALGQAVNLGTGSEISIGALCELVGRLLGKDLVVETCDERKRPSGSEVERLLSDNSRAAETIGWAPAVTLEEGLTRTIDWLTDQARTGRGPGYVV